MCSGLCPCLQLLGPKCQTAIWKGPDWSAGWWEMCGLAAAITPANCQTCEWCCPGLAKSSWSARRPQKQKWIHLQPHGAEKTYPSCCYSVGQLCLTLCDPMDWSMRGPPVPHHLLEFAQVHVHCIGDILVKPTQIINHRIISNKCCTELSSFWSGRQHIEKQKHYFGNKGPSSQGYGFSSGHVWMWELDCEESWTPKNWCFWTGVLEKSLESPLDCKEIQPVLSEGDQSWVFIGKTDVEGETPIVWPSDAKTWLIWKDSDAGKDWRQEEKGMTEDEMVGWHHRLNGHEFG